MECKMSSHRCREWEAEEEVAAVAVEEAEVEEVAEVEAVVLIYLSWCYLQPRLA